MFKTFLLLLTLLCLIGILSAQPTEVYTPPSSTLATKSWLDGGAQENFMTSAPLSHPTVREADILWEKRIWRVIDTREKINLPFRNPDHGLFNIIKNGIFSGRLTAYSAEDDRFSTALTINEVEQSLTSSDTVMVYNFAKELYEPQIVNDEFDADRIKRWRIQEVWYFDSRHSKMQVRIIGIAPLVEKQSEHEVEAAYETNLFWINYEEARPWLAQHQIAQWGNDHSQTSWEDLFAMRRFHSYIYKQNDMLGRRIQDYASGRELLLESEKIEQQIQNYEHDVWSY